MSRSADESDNEKEICDYFLNDMLRSETSELPEYLKSKVSNIIADFHLDEYMQLNVHGTSLLDVLLPKYELTYEERETLKECLQKHINRNTPLLINQLDEITGGECSRIIASGPEAEGDALGQFQNLVSELNGQFEKCSALKDESSVLMREWIDLKAGDAMESNESAVDCLQVESKLLDIQSKITDVNVLLKTYGHVENSKKAYGAVHEDILKEIEQTKAKIEHYKRIIHDDSIF